MEMRAPTAEEPPSPIARPVPGRASPTVAAVQSHHPEVRASLDGWLRAAQVLDARPLSPLTRTRLGDCRRITEELRAVLAGAEPGEGPPSGRVLRAAFAYGRVQGLCSMFVCPAAVFVEFLVAAPWNILGPRDPADPRTVRGSGTVLVGEAVALSRRHGRRGRVALQAENPRTRAFYERVGFRRIQAADQPLLLVPRRASGWSPSVVRVAEGRAGPEEERSPWLLLDLESREVGEARGAETFRATGP